MVANIPTPKFFESAPTGRRLFNFLIAISIALVIVTIAAYVFRGRDLIPHLLRQFSLGTENNIGAWWSGALLLLGAVHCFDGYTAPAKSIQERRGWLTLAFILLCLSLDEVGSIHEYVANGDLRNLIPIGMGGTAILIYAIFQLVSGGTDRRLINRVILGFVLFASIAIQEYLQHTIEWSSDLIYGLRAAVEEGTEICAALILIGVARTNTYLSHDSNSSSVFAIAANFRSQVIVVAFVLLPLTVGASFILPYPGGPADWLAVSLYLFCALNVMHDLQTGRQRLTRAFVLLLILYIAGSAMSNAVKLGYTPSFMDVTISLRGLSLSLLLLCIMAVMRATGRRPPAVKMTICAFAIAAAAFWPNSQLLWVTIPSAVALWVYSIESRQRSELAYL